MARKDDLIRESILRNMAEGLIVLALDGKVDSVNPATEKILDRTAQQLTGQKMASVFYGNAKNDRFNRAMLDAVSDPLTTPHRLVPFYTGAETRQLRLSTSYLLDGQTPRGVIVVIADLTELLAPASNELVS